MKKVIAVVLSAVMVALLVAGCVDSEDRAGGNAEVNISGTWIVEYQDTYVLQGQFKSGNYTMELYQSGNDVFGSYVVPATQTTPEIRCPVMGEVYDGNTTVLTIICVGNGYVGITKARGTVSLNDTRSGTYMGSDNSGKIWEGIFTANRPIV